MLQSFLNSPKKPSLLSFLILLITIFSIYIFRSGSKKLSAPIRIGVLHSLTGTMALSEKPLIDAVQMAVEEINAKGGLLGRQLVTVVADGKSDPQIFTAEAQRLIDKEKVSVLFACWTSQCRQAVRPIVEKSDHLMFYPLHYEGLEQSPNIIYLGSAPNQHIVPGTRWALEKFGKNVYLIGSDYIFPHTANIMIRDLVTANKGHVLGEQYVSLGNAVSSKIIKDIKSKKPQVIFNTLNGDSNSTLFSELVKANLSDIPILSFSVTENEITTWGGTTLTQHYSVAGYFQSLATDHNKTFVAAFKKRFGENRNISDPMESSYVGVHLWAQAVLNQKSATPQTVNSQGLLRQSYVAPSGIVSLDRNTRHLWKMFRVGKVRPDGQFDIITSSKLPLRPAPWPMYRTKDEWQTMVKNKLAELKPGLGSPL